MGAGGVSCQGRGGPGIPALGGSVDEFLSGHDVIFLFSSSVRFSPLSNSILFK